MAAAVAKPAVQAVGIPDGNGCNACVVLQSLTTAIANGLVGLDVSDLQYGGFQCRHVVHELVGSRVDAIEPEPEAAHVQMILREMFDGSRIANVPQDFVAESGL